MPPESLESADLHLLPGGDPDSQRLLGEYPLVNKQFGEKGPVEIVDLPIKHVDFPIVM